MVVADAGNTWGASRKPSQGVPEQVDDVPVAKMQSGTGAVLPALERRMTDTTELDVINEALAIIDRGLGDMMHRELVSTDEVADLLLDVRTLLSAQLEPVATN
jgi:hypothetical protein